MNRQEMLKKMRERMSKEGKGLDPHMWKCPPATKEDLQYKFYVLPPVQKGDKVESGVASHDMDLWYVEVGTHWVDNQPTECPRVHDGDDCPICTLGFDLMRDEQDPDRRKEIVRTYLPQTKYVVNIYFPDLQKTPEDLRDTVKWYQMPKTVFDIMKATFMLDNDGGDEHNPLAYGDFYWTGIEDFDDGSKNPGAYMFLLIAERQGGFNNYKTSRFLPNTRGPIIKNSDGSPNVEKIQEILDSRHDIFTKFQARDQDKLQQVVKKLTGEDVMESSSGFDTDETQSSPSEEPQPAGVGATNTDEDELQSILASIKDD